MNQYNTQESGKLFEILETEPIVGNVVLGVEFQEKRKEWDTERNLASNKRRKPIKFQLSPTFPAIPTQKEK